MKLIYMGTPDFAVPPLEALLKNGYEVAAVVTQPDKPKGRKGLPLPSPVKECALRAGLPVLQPEKMRDPDFMDALHALAPDLIVVTAYGRILPEQILSLPRYGCINIHASLLPRYRGAAPIQHAVLDGEASSGVTIMQMNAGLDTGDILSQEEISLAPDETAGTLFEKLAPLGAALLLKTLPLLEAGRLVPVSQPQESPTPYAAMLQKKDGLLDFSLPAAVLERRVRGLDPWPGAYTTVRGKNLKIWKTSLPEEQTHAAAAPGTILSAAPEGLRVSCGEGELLLEEVQLEGRKRLRAAEFLRGLPLQPGEVLGERA